jgi:hypothetical protein
MLQAYLKSLLWLVRLVAPILLVSAVVLAGYGFTHPYAEDIRALQGQGVRFPILVGLSDVGDGCIKSDCEATAWSSHSYIALNSFSIFAVNATSNGTEVDHVEGGVFLLVLFYLLLIGLTVWCCRSIFAWRAPNRSSKRTRERPRAA